MASKSKLFHTAKEKNVEKKLAYWAGGVFLLKLLVISNISGGAWYAADGVNYVKGVEALINEGIFSTEENLTYWPAGYPLFIYFLSFFGLNWVLTTVAITQSALFSFSTFYFVKQILKTRLAKYVYISFVLILFNPTLSLSSLSIGYESIAASGSLLIIGIITSDLCDKKDSKFIYRLILVSAISGFLGFIQPRLLVAGMFILFFWIIYRKFGKLIPIFISLSLIILLFFPATLTFRNQKAVGVTSVSTNLGNTMNIGAGNSATGGYDSKEHGVNCNITSSDVAKADSQRVVCVLKWYVSNPSSAIKLFYNKTIYFWSPWSGPVLSGTMGLNPWLKINPITSINKTPEGAALVGGMFGKVFAYIWIFSGLGLLLYGFSILWRAKGAERFIGLLAMTIISSSWAITLISIGDHRFRLPVMGMSLFLQAIGLKTLLRGGKPAMVDGPALR
jgi:hypothetical protein